jgi:hypothetical protein
MMIVVLTAVSVLLILLFFYINYHITLINRELDSISKDQSRQNKDIRNLMIAYVTLTEAIKKASEPEVKPDFWIKTMGEA